MLSPGFGDKKRQGRTPHKFGELAGTIGMDARLRARTGRTPIPNNRVAQQGNDNEDHGKETGGDVLCFVQGIAKSHEPGCQKGPEIAVHMILVLSIFLEIYYYNAVGSIMYPIGYMNDFGWGRTGKKSEIRMGVRHPYR